MFRDRKEAGGKLADALREHVGGKTLVLALPRGGVPVAFEIARMLDAPLDTIVARKIGSPDNPEYALGAIAPGDIVVLDVPPAYRDEHGAGRREGLERIIRDEEQEMQRRVEKYKSGSYSRGVEPQTVIVVDDGIATGKTARAALTAARASYREAKLVFAAPVGAPDAIDELRNYTDEVFCLYAPPEFSAVGEWYKHFDQTTDEEVTGLLERAARL